MRCWCEVSNKNCKIAWKTFFWSGSWWNPFIFTIRPHHFLPPVFWIRTTRPLGQLSLFSRFNQEYILTVRKLHYFWMHFYHFCRILLYIHPYYHLEKITQTMLQTNLSALESQLSKALLILKITCTQEAIKCYILRKIFVWKNIQKCIKLKWCQNTWLSFALSIIIAKLNDLNLVINICRRLKTIISF